LKPEQWGSPLVQEKYQGEKACDKRQQQQQHNNNNNNNNGEELSTVVGLSVMCSLVVKVIRVGIVTCFSFCPIVMGDFNHGLTEKCMLPIWCTVVGKRIVTYNI
jgi:hypothetical protein